MLRNTLNTFITATLIMLLGVSSSAQAMVPAGSRITSTSLLCLSFEQGACTTKLTESVTVTIGLQRSKPLIVLKEITRDQSILSKAKWINETTESLTYKYTITTKANGPATYTVKAEAAAEAVENLNKEPKVRLTGNQKDPIKITLGATAVLEAVGPVITVPSDGNLKGSDRTTVVNGIKAGDTVVIKGIVYTVSAVEDLGHDDGATITLTEPPPDDLVRGDPIAEQQEFTVDLSEVRLKDIDETQVTVTITATQPDHAELDFKRNLDKFTVFAPRDPEMQFYVRNISEDDEANPVSDGENIITYGDNTYFPTHSEPRHSPGDILEYLVKIRAGNEGPLTPLMGGYGIPVTMGLEYVEDSTFLNGVMYNEMRHDKDGQWFVRYVGGENKKSKTIATNETTHITYQMKVIAGELVQDNSGDKPASGVAQVTYSGCLIQGEQDDREKCIPDGTRWEDITENPKLEFYTACQRGVQWEVGANGMNPQARQQADVHECAAGERTCTAAQGRCRLIGAEQCDSGKWDVVANTSLVGWRA